MIDIFKGINPVVLSESFLTGHLGYKYYQCIKKMYFRITLLILLMYVFTTGIMFILISLLRSNNLFLASSRYLVFGKEYTSFGLLFDIISWFWIIFFIFICYNCSKKFRLLKFKYHVIKNYPSLLEKVVDFTQTLLFFMSFFWVSYEVSFIATSFDNRDSSWNEDIYFLAKLNIFILFCIGYAFLFLSKLVFLKYFCIKKIIAIIKNRSVV